ncbi:hypothetical protein [Botrimarina sp.]|uniref:hypothetical protein n=1 Tax=Botrimarina sp. TaxID=2795802 RepID=UPI0032F01121
MQQPRPYNCVTQSLDAFLAQLVRYVASGHYFYVTGHVPGRKSPEEVDRKLILLYGLGKPKWERARRRLGEQAGIHYLRHGKFFVLIATHGRHQFFEDHQKNICDIRRTALKVRGYSIRYTFSDQDQRWKVFVRLDKPTYQSVRAHLLDLARRPSYRDTARLIAEVESLPFQGYAPVRGQVLAIIKAMNRVRRHAGVGPLPMDIVPRMRPVRRVFVTADEEQQAA